MDDQEYQERRERRRRKNLVMKTIRLVVTAAIFIPLIFLCCWIGSKVLFPERTEVKGLDSEITQNASKRAFDKITVKNPAGRNVELQRFDEKKKKWKKAKSFKTADKKKVKVKIKFPKNWNNKTYSKWRVFIKRSFGHSKYVSDEIDVTCTNRGNTKVKCASAVVYCKENGKVIYNKKMHKKLANASTTKMITAILAFEKTEDKEVVTISRRASITPYSLFPWGKGFKFYMRDMMRSMLIASSNASASAIAEHISGSYEDFRKLMNKRAKELGCKNTNFVTPSGLDANGHHSTAYDIALINAKAIEFDEYNKIMLMKKWKFRCINKKDNEYLVETTNDLLEENIKGYMGGKTGTTAQAGNCLSSAYKWKGKTYIITVFDASSRFQATKDLMKYVRNYA